MSRAAILKARLLADRRLASEVLSMVPVERIEKLKLLQERTTGTFRTPIKKRIDQLHREAGLDLLRDKVQECNERIANRKKEVHHG